MYIFIFTYLQTGSQSQGFIPYVDSSVDSAISSAAFSQDRHSSVPQTRPAALLPGAPLSPGAALGNDAAGSPVRTATVYRQSPERIVADVSLGLGSAGLSTPEVTQDGKLHHNLFTRLACLVLAYEL